MKNCFSVEYWTAFIVMQSHLLTYYLYTFQDKGTKGKKMSSQDQPFIALCMHESDDQGSESGEVWLL